MSLSTRLDRIASELEKLDPRLAFAIDRVSDKLAAGLPVVRKPFPDGELKSEIEANWKKIITKAFDSHAIKDLVITMNDRKDYDVNVDVTLQPTEVYEHMTRVREALSLNLPSHASLEAVTITKLSFVDDSDAYKIHSSEEKK